MTQANVPNEALLARFVLSHGIHSPFCAWTERGKPCDCGLDAATAVARAALAGQEATAPTFEDGWRDGRNAGITEVIDRLIAANRWIDSLHEERGQVWTTKDELRSWLIIQPKND